MQEEKRAQEEGYSSSDAYSEEVSSSDAYSGSHEIDCSNILFVKAHSDFFIIFWCRKKADQLTFTIGEYRILKYAFSHLLCIIVRGGTLISGSILLRVQHPTKTTSIAGREKTSHCDQFACFCPNDSHSED